MLAKFAFARYDESKHKRVSKGQKGGGQFAPKGGGEGATSAESGSKSESSEQKKPLSKWARSLNRKEKLYVQMYASDVKHSSNINRALREGKPLSKTDQDVEGALTSAINKAGVLPHSINVYRGVVLPKEKADTLLAFAKAEKTKKLLTLSGFQSTSLDPMVAGMSTQVPIGDESSKHGIMFSIETNMGVDISELSSSPNEQEILLGHNWEYEVTGVSKATVAWREQDMIHLKLVKSGGDSPPKDPNKQKPKGD